MIQEYFKEFKPSLDRSNSKYYEEMQILSHSLVKYLKMNNNPEEHPYQGDYNLTYLKENITDKDFDCIVEMMLKRIPLGRVAEIIKSFGDNSIDIILNQTNKNEDALKEIATMKDRLQELEHQIK